MKLFELLKKENNPEYFLVENKYSRVYHDNENKRIIVDCGNLSSGEALKYVEKVRLAYKTKRIFNEAKRSK